MRVGAAEIADRLAQSAEQVASMLLPGGKRDGNYWSAGDTSGDSGKSLKVYLAGPKAGRWRDYATDQHGDLLDLWAETRRQDIGEAMKDAADWLGIRQPALREPERQFSRPKARIEPLSEAHRKWLMGRGLTLDVIENLRIGSKGDAIAFPSYRGDQLVAVKYRTPDKRMWSEADCEPILFGWQAVPSRARSICLVEGEIDAASMLVYGMPTLSVPNGGGAKQHVWIEREFDHLDRFDTIYVAMDQDEPGQVAAKEILDRLGPERCRLVDLPKKDANECLQAGIRTEAMREFFRYAITLDPDELKRAPDFRADLHRQFYGQPDTEVGFSWPFPQQTDELRLRPSEVVLVAGENASGKSQFVGHLAHEAMREGFRTCVASMEFRAPRYLKRMARQAGATHDLSPEYLDAIVSHWNDRLWVFSVRGTAKRERMLEVFRYARRRYGVRVFVIDNLAKCGIAEDDYTGQKDFVDQLTDFANETETTVILVHHMRKGGAGRDGVKGSGGITDMVDTVLILWRNRKKEDQLRDLSDDASDDERRDIDSLPDGVVTCIKQRNYEGLGDGEPKKGYWFDTGSYQFLAYPRAKPYRYVDWSAIEQRGAA